MKEYYIDLGSSTIKTYLYEEGKLLLIEENSIYFKNGFTGELGISLDNKEALNNYYKELISTYNLNSNNTFIYATGIFRNLTDNQKEEIVAEFKNNLNLTLNIISHDMENYYLEKAFMGNYNNKKVMVINMGGKTTEIVTIKDGTAEKRMNINVGVAELLNKFPEVNNDYSKVTIEDIASFTKEQIQDVEFDQDYDCAIFTGGELRFEKLTGYNLVPNTLFNDGIHDFMVTIEDFLKGNEKIFFDLTLQQLYSLMPHNPKWMDGARPGAVLPQAIFEKANIKVIIPSDLNLINGVIKDKYTTN